MRLRHAAARAAPRRAARARPHLLYDQAPGAALAAKHEDGIFLGHRRAALARAARARRRALGRAGVEEDAGKAGGGNQGGAAGDEQVSVEVRGARDLQLPPPACARGAARGASGGARRGARGLLAARVARTARVGDAGLHPGGCREWEDFYCDPQKARYQTCGEVQSV